MNKILIGSGALGALLGVLFAIDTLHPHIAHAQTQIASTTQSPRSIKPILIAEISLYDASLARLADDDYRVSFRLYNGGEMQNDVKYAVSLLDQKNRIVSTQLFERVINIEKGQNAFVSEKLIIPKGLSGTYSVQVQASTIGGLPLGYGIAGKITLDDKAPVSLGTCTLNKSVIDASSSITLSCSVNGSGSYTLGSRLFHGNEIVQAGNASSQVANGKGAVTFKNIGTPGVYTVRTSLYENGSPVGEEKVNMFAVNGTSVSILNLLLFGNSFKKGDVATTTLSLSVFTNTEKKLHLEILLSGKNGDCSSRTFIPVTSRLAFEIPISITKTCINPTLSVRVADDVGTLYAQKTLSLVSEHSSADLKTQAGYGLAIVLALLALVTLARDTTKKRKK